MEIENFSATIVDLTTVKIYYTVGEKEIEVNLPMEIDYTEYEAPTGNCPGTAESAEIADIPDATKREADTFFVWLETNKQDIETQILAHLKIAEDYAVAEAMCRPKLIRHYKDRRGF